MPARDFYHDIVRNALIKDSWIRNYTTTNLIFVKQLFLACFLAKTGE